EARLSRDARGPQLHHLAQVSRRVHAVVVQVGQCARENTAATTPTSPATSTRRRIRRRRGVSHSAFPWPWLPRIEWIKRRCAGPGRFRMARAISRRPRRSAIRIVAELLPLVDFISRDRKPAGTSSTERYTKSAPPVEISTVDVWNTPEFAGFAWP